MSSYPKITTTKWPPEPAQRSLPTGDGEIGLCEVVETLPRRPSLSTKKRREGSKVPSPGSGSAPTHIIATPAAQCSPAPSLPDPIFHPSRNDVLSHPASAAEGPSMHHGNIFYREVCRGLRAEYCAAPRGRSQGGKAEIASRVVAAVRSQNPPGRFLRLNDEEGVWYEMEEGDAIKKAQSLLMRDKTPKWDKRRMKRERRARRAEMLRAEEVAFAAAAAAAVSSTTSDRRRKSRSGAPLTSIPDPPLAVPISAPTNCDVLSFFQNGAVGTCQHFGNKVYRILCDKFRPDYCSAPKDGSKLAVAAKVVEAVRAQEPPGRFLRRHDQVWYEMAEDAVLTKVTALLMKGKGGLKQSGEAGEEEEEESSDDESVVAEEASEEMRPRRKRQKTTPENEPGGLSWNDMYFRLALYKSEKGDCAVPVDYTGHNNLGAWISEQRRYFNNRNIYKPHDTERVRALSLLGMDFCVLQERWEEMFKRLRDYKEIHGNIAVIQNDRELCTWMKTQRVQYSDIQRNGRRAERPHPLSQNRIDRLNALGMVWRKRGMTSWEESFQQLLEYKDEYGHCIVPQHYDQNRHLGEWVTRMRYQKGLLEQGRKSQISPEQVERLEEVGFVWKVLHRR